ncbi:MAG TPA: RnfABCDGE type electron transport complex subunit D [Planctomycetota bacterium]|nr:RnfABCDGE type electron transport complex subunit D [Planctomycetota bacterium]
MSENPAPQGAPSAPPPKPAAATAPAAIPNAPERWLVGSSPHQRSAETVSQIMWTVVLALLPTCVAGVVVFGWYAGVVILLAAASAVVAEAVVQRSLGRRVTISDGSAVVTGALLACCLPPNVKWYVPVVGSFVAIFVGKQLFGGLGRNYFNPALIGRAFLQFAFPTQLMMPQWPIVTRTSVFDSITGDIFKVAAGTPGGPDATSFATPLAAIGPGPRVLPASDSPLAAIGNGMGIGNDGGTVLRDLFLGNVPGCIGEVSKLAIILGGLILVVNRYINWRLPVAYAAGALLAVLLLPVRDIAGHWGGIYAGEVHWRIVGETLLVHLLSGGLLLGAVFMITDMVTRPTTVRGQVIYGLAAGVIVAMIRLYGGYPEGVCYSILLVNAVRLVVEKYSMPRVFGAKRS